MAGINVLGTPNTADYSLGRGIVYFGTLDANNLVTHWRDVGNCTEFKTSLTVEKLQHKSSRAGLKIVDKEVVVSEELALQMTLDELNFDNIAFFFSGDASTENNNAAAIAGVAGDDNLTVDKLGCWYDLYTGVNGRPAADVSNERIYDILVTSVKSDGGGITYTEGVDYILDKHFGRIFIIETGAMTAGPTDYDIVIAANATAKKTDKVGGLTNSGKAVAVKFIADNPVNSDQAYEYQFHSCTLYGDGDFALIGDQFTTMTLKGVAGSNPAMDAASPYVTIRTHADAHS